MEVGAVVVEVFVAGGVAVGLAGGGGDVQAGAVDREVLDQEVGQLDAAVEVAVAQGEEERVAFADVGGLVALVDQEQGVLQPQGG